MVWVPEGNRVRPIKVTVGLSDGTLTEVAGEGIKEGTEIAMGEVEGQQASRRAPTGGGSPFTPQLFGPKGK